MSVQLSCKIHLFLFSKFPMCMRFFEHAALSYVPEQNTQMSTMLKKEKDIDRYRYSCIVSCCDLHISRHYTSSFRSLITLSSIVLALGV